MLPVCVKIFLRTTFRRGEEWCWIITACSEVDRTIFLANDYI